MRQHRPSRSSSLLHIHAKHPLAHEEPPGVSSKARGQSRAWCHPQLRSHPLCKSRLSPNNTNLRGQSHLLTQDKAPFPELDGEKRG